MSELKHKRFADGMKYLVKKKWNNDTSMIHEWNFPAPKPRSLIFFILLSIKFLSLYFQQEMRLWDFFSIFFSRKRESLPYKQVQKLKELKKLSLPTVVREVKRQ